MTRCREGLLHNLLRLTYNLDELLQGRKLIVLSPNGRQLHCEPQIFYLLQYYAVGLSSLCRLDGETEPDPPGDQAQHRCFVVPFLHDVQCEARGLAGGENPVVIEGGRRAWNPDNWLPFQGAKFQSLSFDKWVRLGEGQHNPLDADSVGFQLGEISRKRVHEPHVQLLLAQLGARCDRVARKEIQSHVRPPLAEFAQDRGEFPAVCSAVGESDAQASDLALSHESGSLYATFKIGEASSRFIKEPPAAL